MSIKLWMFVLFTCSLHIQLAMAAGSDMEGDSMTQSQSLPSFVHQVSKQRRLDSYHVIFLTNQIA